MTVPRLVMNSVMADILIANAPSRIVYGHCGDIERITERLSNCDIPELEDQRMKEEFIYLFEHYCRGRYRCPLYMGKYGNSHETQYDSYNHKVDLATEFWANFSRQI